MSPFCASKGRGSVLGLWGERCPPPSQRWCLCREPSVRGPTEPWGDTPSSGGLDGRTLNQRGFSLTFKINRMTLGSFWACLGLITAFFLPVSSCGKAMSVLYLTALYPEAHDCGFTATEEFCLRLESNLKSHLHLIQTSRQNSGL